MRFPLAIGGDGRADSPGHSAKYGSYAWHHRLEHKQDSTYPVITGKLHRYT